MIRKSLAPIKFSLVEIVSKPSLVPPVSPAAENQFCLTPQLSTLVLEKTVMEIFVMKPLLHHRI